MSNVKCQMSTAYVDPWDMLNDFCFYVYGQMLLFIGENGNDCFYPTLTRYWTNHRAGSQLKMSECQTKAGNQRKF